MMGLKRQPISLGFCEELDENVHLKHLSADKLSPDSSGNSDEHFLSST